MGKLRHIVESQQFNLDFLAEMFQRAEEFSHNGFDGQLSKTIMASMFYEPSTRTRFSFEAAMHRLGGSVITTENAREFSSFAKGESLEDSVHVLSGYCDLIVMRHSDIGAAKRAAEISSVPVINAGDGAGQHPTQALLDLFTIYRHLKRIDGIKVAMVGDLRYGRTVRSLAYLLAKYEGVEMYFLAPPVSQMHQDIKGYLDRQGVAWQDSEDLESVLPQVDCVYMTRIQKERFLDVKEFEMANNRFRLTPENIQAMQEKAIIMHPLPRVGEIDPAVDRDARAVYFEQARNGLWVRMALILYVMEHWG